MDFQTKAAVEFVSEIYEVMILDRYGKISNRQRHQCKTYVEDLGNGVILEMVAIPTGIFGMRTMGYSDKANLDEGDI